MLNQKEAVLALNPRAIWRCVDGEAIVLDLNTGTYFGLNQVAARAWALIQDEITRSALLEGLAAEFEVSLPELAADLDELLNQLLQHRLIVEYREPA